MATLAYPPPLEAARGTVGVEAYDGTADLETPILIVGGGPVGMLQALAFARLHKQRCTLIEREFSTTIFPKMEYTNGRSMEIYRRLGLVEELRKIGNSEVPEHFPNDETIVTSLVDGGKLVSVWERDGPEQQRARSRQQNDGSQYLEPHMRCHQIVLEKWLKEKVKAEPLIESHWGTAFVGLDERDNHILTRVHAKEDDRTLHIKSQYVIGCDGGGSWVRKSAHLESKREYLNLTMAFVHFRARNLRKTLFGPRAWHYNVIGGGILVSQNEDDLYTCHFITPPDVEPSTLTEDEILGMALGGCQGAKPVEYDEIYCRGVWRVDVAIADKFRSQGGRVLIAGDAAHQLSPIGGHGLNSGLGDVFDLAWKLSGVLQGWAGPHLLDSYNAERQKIAFENLDHVQEALGTIVGPIFGSHVKYGPSVLNGDGPEGKEARDAVAALCKEGHWIHDQNGNILGAAYKNSPVIIEADEAGERPKGTNEQYTPTTFPGSRAPHVWTSNGKSSLDTLDPTAYVAVDFSPDSQLSRPFVEVAQKMRLPLKVVSWNKTAEPNLRKVYERDLVLVRPDGYVAWRCKENDSKPVSNETAQQILRIVSGHAL